MQLSADDEGQGDAIDVVDSPPPKRKSDKKDKKTKRGTRFLISPLTHTTIFTWCCFVRVTCK